MQLIFKHDLKWKGDRSHEAGNKIRLATGNKEWMVHPVTGEVEISSYEIASDHGFIVQLGAMHSLGVRGYVIIVDSLYSDLVRWDLTDKGVTRFGPIYYDVNMHERR